MRVFVLCLFQFSLISVFSPTGEASNENYEKSDWTQLKKLAGAGMGETHGEMLGINGCCTHHSRTDIMWEAGMVEVRELIGTSLMVYEKTVCVVQG
jgi:hypothetical protein